MVYNRGSLCVRWPLDDPCKSSMLFLIRMKNIVQRSAFSQFLTDSFLEKTHLILSVLKILLRYCSDRVVRHKKPSMGIYIPLQLSNGLDAYFTGFPNFELIFSPFSSNLTTVSTSIGLQLLETTSEPFLEVCKSSHTHFPLDSRHQISRNYQKIT